MVDDVDATEAMTAGLRAQRDPWEALQRAWPDGHTQLARIYESINDAIIAVGADDWTDRAQLEHFVELRSELDDFSFDLNRQAEAWETGEW